MDQVLHANIFFIIASVATVAFCILVVLILYQVFKVVRAVRRIVDRIESGSEQLAEDISSVRSFVARGSFLSRLFGFMSSKRKRERQYDVEVDEL